MAAFNMKSQSTDGLHVVVAESRINQDNSSTSFLAADNNANV